MSEQQQQLSIVQQIIERHLSADGRILNMRGAEIGDEDVAALAQALPDCKNLVEINLNDNRIGDKGAMALAQVLPDCKKLTELGLWDNQIGDEGAAALAQALPRCKNLFKLNLCANDIGDEGVAALAKAIQESPSIGNISLYFNRRTNKGLLYELVGKPLEARYCLRKVEERKANVRLNLERARDELRIKRRRHQIPGEQLSFY